MNKFFKKSDLILALVIITACLSVFLIQKFSTDNLVATVHLNGEVAETIDLSKVDKAYTFSPCDGVVLEADKNKIRFVSSTCPDKLCVNSGWLNISGVSSACLPEKVVVTLSGQDSHFDVITY